MEESDQKKKKAEKVYFYLQHNKLKKTNLDQVFSESRSGTIAHKNKKELQQSPNNCPPNARNFMVDPQPRWLIEWS
jgi:hypothetical protein